ncbi:oxidoreductase yajO1 [Rhodopirellula sallentina SM41]|uniref:Oxidoreductase yajO1 n=1 Tax=Rhodopirellula sallentina SM41 TaxID=1263870 RepID=M5U9P9_9BACT|nr:oxidoreductase yajO1 [Rhodopirellula sallentina SM41]
MAPIIAQSAEKGVWPAVLCAAEPNVESQKLYGPTKRADMVGPIGECPLDPCVLDRKAAEKLWSTSQEKTSLAWSV